MSSVRTRQVAPYCEMIIPKETLVNKVVAFSMRIDDNYIMEKNTTFTSHNESQKGINGTSLQGYAKASRVYLEMLFGPPLSELADEYKTSHEWHISIKHGQEEPAFVSIYDYKSDSSDDPGEEIHWHIGAKNSHHADQVIDFITTGKTFKVDV